MRRTQEGKNELLQSASGITEPAQVKIKLEKGTNYAFPVAFLTSDKGVLKGRLDDGTPMKID